MDSVIKTSFFPKMALIIYEQDNGFNENDYYIESRDIHQGKKGFEMLSGSPLKTNTLRKIMDSIKLSKKKINVGISGLIPDNLLHFSKKNYVDNIVWYVKAGPQHLSFSKSLGIENGLMDLPTIIFKLVDNNVEVFAVKTNSPKETTRIYYAPFHNVSSDGLVCMGSAKYTRTSDLVKLMKNVEKAFFSSVFTHLNMDSPIEGNLNTYMNKAIKNKTPFDKSVLTPSSKYKYLKDLI